MSPVLFILNDAPYGKMPTALDSDGRFRLLGSTRNDEGPAPRALHPPLFERCLVHQDRHPRHGKRSALGVGRVKFTSAPTPYSRNDKRSHRACDRTQYLDQRQAATPSARRDGVLILAAP